MIPLPSLSDAAAWLGAGVVAIALVVLGSWLGRWTAPEANTVTTAPDTVRVERTITKRDTVTETVAETIVRYDTVTTTDTAFVPVPTDWQPTGLIGSAPLDIGQDEATLTYWNHRGRRFEQKVYDIPQPTWSLAPSVTAEATPSGPVTSAAVTLGRKSLSLSAGYEVAQDYRGWTVGLTWTPYKLEW
jgi:hypothetical protein